MDYSLLLCVHNCTEKRIRGRHCNGLETEEMLVTPVDKKHVTFPTSDSFASSLSSTLSTSSSISTTTPSPQQPYASSFLTLNNSLTPRSPSFLNAGTRPLRSRVVIGPGIYHCGIIDILQTWTWQKKIEQWVKRIFFGHWFDYEELSAVEPNWYCERFIVMLERVFEFPSDYNNQYLGTDGYANYFVEDRDMSDNEDDEKENKDGP